MPEDFMYITGYEAAPGSNAIPLPINEEGNPFSVNTINFTSYKYLSFIGYRYLCWYHVHAQKPPVVSAVTLPLSYLYLII